MARLLDDNGKPVSSPRGEPAEKREKRAKRGVKTESTGRRPRSKRFPAIQRRWAKLPPKHRTHQVLRAMCDAGRVAESVTNDRLRLMEIAEEAAE